MTPLLFLFTLCVAYAGEQDCSWEWEYVPTDEEFKSEWKFYTWLEAEYKIDSENIGAFTHFQAKKVILRDMKWISHEVEHIICWKNFVEKHAGVFDFHTCNQEIDTRDILKQVRNNATHKSTTEPPATNPRIDITSGKAGIVL